MTQSLYVGFTRTSVVAYKRTLSDVRQLLGLHRLVDGIHSRCILIAAQTGDDHWRPQPPHFQLR